VIDITSDGLVARELTEGVTLEQLQNHTDAKVSQ
jgi:acyl CoA:acetate/3-ketoacid CoA transferase beta subunit